MKHFDVYRIVKTVYSRSANSFETLKRRVLWCFLVLFTSDVFAKKKYGAGLLTVPKSAASLSMFFLSH